MKTTEQPSHYDNLEHMTTADLLASMNQEDMTVPQVIAGILPDIERAVEAVYEKMDAGGRLFYLGSGTSGRLGVVDASECPPTFGVDHGRVVGLIAGGDAAIRKAQEFAEDDPMQGWKDLQAHDVSERDAVIGIAASGSTPYVMGAIKACKAHNVITGCITCNAGSPLSQAVDYPMVAVVGPEFVTGSTRMKAGTAQKLILNMLSTAVMIRLGHVRGNRMVDMQLSNDKLVERGIRMIQEATGAENDVAEALLNKYGSVRKAIDQYSGK
ncbi:MAG: N-acetylmuramic acid 6-phosphate etherase [Bacteroidia bacterium]